jgi:enediyne biosynthesis protein E3
MVYPGLLVLKPVKSLCGEIFCGLFGLPLEETSVEKRGFRRVTDEMRTRLEQVGETFLHGYHAALRSQTLSALAAPLNSIDTELRGFAFEGAAMGLALLDRLTPWRRTRLTSFLRGDGDAHAYMVHVGVGWVWARVPFGFRRFQRRLDPLLCWLAFDGWGFHEGYFHWPKYICGWPPPRRLAGYEKRAFDQGLGRSWWFVNGGRPALIGRTITELPVERRPDLWSGVGLAATYAGIASERDLCALRELAGQWRPQLAQGAAFAAKARQRAGNLTPYTDLAAEVLCGLSATDAARLCDTTLANLPAAEGRPPYEIWRQRIQQYFHASPQPAIPPIPEHAHS